MRNMDKHYEIIMYIPNKVISILQHWIEAPLKSVVIVNGVLCVSHFEIFTVIPAYKTLSITNSFRRNFWCQSSRTVTESNPPRNLFKNQQIKTHINSHMKKSTDISCQFSSTQD